MILPIVGYGSPVLRTVAKDIDKNYPDLKKLVDDMFETMYKASGVGLAAPQIDLSIRLFVIDASPMKESDPLADGFPQIIEERGDLWSFQEGCLSLPDIHEEVSRPSIIKIKYFDEDFLEHEEELDGIRARVFQHEFDHIQGKVFVDRLSSIRRVRTDYKMKTLKKGR